LHADAAPGALDTDSSTPDGQASRRAVIIGAGVAVVAGAAGFGWYRLAAPTPTASGGEYTAPSGGSGTPTALTSLADVPERGGVILPDQKLVVTRESGDKVHCFSAVCTHQGCLVNQVGNGRISCPCHGSAFDAATGAVVRGPADEPLEPEEIEVTDQGQVRRT
jgi:Rieske Fe-S protein